MRTRVLIVPLIGFLLAASARAEPVAPPSITTTGESVIYVTPDEVIVGVGVETYDKDLDKAKADNDDRSTRMLKAVKDLGVEDKHVQSDTLQIEIQYDTEKHERLIMGYRARRAYSITLKDPKKFEKLTDAVLKNGANQLMGFEYKTTELRKQHSCDAVVYSVELQDGQVKLKAKAKS